MKLLSLLQVKNKLFKNFKFSFLIFNLNPPPPPPPQTKYCDKIVEQLDPEKKYIDYKLSRNFCTMYQGVYVKDIRKLGRNIKDIIIIDVNKKKKKKKKYFYFKDIY